METIDYDIARLAKLTGWRVKGLCQTFMDRGPVIGLTLTDGKVERDIYAFCDMEGNGPGFMWVSGVQPDAGT